MTTVKLNGKDWQPVTVPEGAFDISIKNTTLEGFKKTGGTFFYRDLPPGTYTLPVPKVCSEWTEEEAAGVIPELNCRERYPNYCGDNPIWYSKRKESLFSLCRAQGWVPERTILLTVNDKK